MPIREYKAVDTKKSCPFCKEGFERVEPIDCPAFPICPECSQPVQRQISVTGVGSSTSGFDDRAKRAGLSKFKKLGKGEYEKEY